MKKTIATDGLKCKYEATKTEFYHLTPRTQAIVLFTDYKVRSLFHVEPIWTCFYRKDKRSVHYYLRGADMSIRVIDMNGVVEMRLLTKQEISILKKLINDTFPYGKKGKRTCTYHKVKGNAYHFHLQSIK